MNSIKKPSIQAFFWNYLLKGNYFLKHDTPLTREEITDYCSHPEKYVSDIRFIDRLIADPEARDIIVDLMESSSCVKDSVTYRKPLARQAFDWLNTVRAFFSSYKMAAMGAAAVCMVVLFVMTADNPIAIHIGVTGYTIKTIPDIRSGTGAVEQLVETDVREGQSLKSGEFYRLRITVDQDAYGYILVSDASKEISLMYSGKLQGGSLFNYPDSSQKPFQLDDRVGTETIAVVVSKKPIRQFDQKIDGLKITGIRNAHQLFSDASVEYFSFKHESPQKDR